MSELLRGIVTESTGSRYKVLRDEGGEADAVLRGRLRMQQARTTNPVAVGDVVYYEATPEGENVITEVEPRRNYIIRRASNLSKESHIIAANMDQAFLVASLLEPVTRREFIDRFLVTCEAYGVPGAVVLNKTDLADRVSQERGDFLWTYRTAGYQVFEISADKGEGLEELKKRMTGKTTLLAGNSGVGKSTLIKALSPSLNIRIGEISRYHRKGMHTTTFAHMYPLPGGGYIIDTPGIKGFGLIDISHGEVFRYFPEFMRYSPQCQYYNCTHVHEPGCAVVEALQEGEIALSRYESYLKILDEDGKYRG